MEFFNVLRLWAALLSSVLFLHALPFELLDVNATGQPVDRIVLREGGLFLAIGHGSTWVWNPTDQVIEQVDLTTGNPTDIKIPLQIEPLSAEVEDGSLWVLDAARDKVVRINLTTYEAAEPIDISPYYEEWEFVRVVTGEGTVWIKGEETVLQLDTQANQIKGEPIPAGKEILIAAVANGELWVGSHDDGLITRIDLQTNEITAQFDIGFSVHGLAVSDEAAWVLDEHGFAVVHVDPTTNTVSARIPIEFVASNITAANGDIWVVPAAFDSGAALKNDAFVRIASETQTIVETIPVGEIKARRDGGYLALFEEGVAWAVIFDDALTTLVRLG